MKNRIVNVTGAPLNRQIREYSSGVSELWYDGLKKSYSFSKIGPFVYDNDVKNYFSLVEVELGQALSLKDKLIGFINIDGQMVSPLYSQRYECCFDAMNLNQFEYAVETVFDRLFIDSIAFDQKNSDAREKIKCLAKCYDCACTKRNDLTK